jgi:hypothetical protein
MDNIYDIYDIPVFKSLPSLINFNNNSNDNISKKLNNISIKDIYQDEPFINNNNYYFNKEYFLLILFIVIIIILYLFFIKN